MTKEIHWHYNIGDIIRNNNVDFTIIDRRMHNGEQQYKIKCNKCGFDCGKHINPKRNGRNYIDEYWIYYGNLKKQKNCPCCSGYKHIIVSGINDLATTDPWMIPYFKNKEDVYKYSSSSGEMVEMICPDCFEERKFKICVLKQNGYLPCVCRKECSIPNKISFYTLKELENNKLISDYEREYSPEWAGLYSYDNFFIVNNKRYIIEMDGGFHYKDNKMTYKTAKESKEIDDKKDELAKQHNINIIRIYSPDGQYHDTYINLIHKLEEIVDVSILSEETIMENVHKNFVKIICDYYNQYESEKTMDEISKKFNIHTQTLRDYLIIGTRYAWCNYINQNEKKKIKKEKVIDLFLSNEMTNRKIAKMVGLHESTVRKYLNEERNTGNIPYSKSQTSIKTQEYAKQMGKTVYVYDINGKYVSNYNSTAEIERSSLIDFGIELKSRSISRVCLGKRKQYKGYIFSYIPLHQENQNGSLLLCSNE